MSGYSLLSKIARSKWLVMASMLAFTLIALMLGAVHPALYKVRTSIELHGPATNNAGPPGDDVSPKLDESQVQTQIRIIQSRSLLERVLANLSDADRSRIIDLPRFWWSHSSHDQNLESILRRICAEPSGHADIVDISFVSPDAVAGAHLLTLLTRELAGFDIERSWHATQRNREWTDRQLEDLKQKWEQSELLLTEYPQLSGFTSLAGRADQTQVRPPPTTLKLAQVPAAAATLTEANDPKLRQLKSHLADLDRQIAKWRSLYGASTPTLARLTAETAATDIAIRQRCAALLQNIDAAPRSLTPVEKHAPQAIGTHPTRAQALAHFKILRQDADLNRQIYERAATRFSEANFADASHIGDISVVDPAVPVADSVTPSQFRNGSLGALAGFCVGVAFIALRTQFSHTFSETASLRQQLGLAVLGAIPMERFTPVTNRMGLSSNEPNLNLTFDTDARTAEAYRSVRSSILLRSDKASSPQRLVFTSAASAEGKTSVVGNLGAALASAQRRVLLVDGDLRTPGLHKLFGTDNEHGLADLLNRQIAAVPTMARDVIRETQIPDLYLLSAGQAGARAPEILSSAQLPQLILEFSRGFDFVLIDSPPVLPYADARSLAHAADAVILVVRAASTGRHAALLARDAITQDGSTIAGTILTNWDSSQAVSPVGRYR